MMSVFFHFQYALNRLSNNCIKLYWVILISDKFFLKYEGGGLNWPPTLKKLPSKSAALLGLSEELFLVKHTVCNRYTPTDIDRMYTWL